MSDTFTTDKNNGDPTESSIWKNIIGLQVHVSDEVKVYPRMYYTVDFNAFACILGKLTLRSSSLTHARLNDPNEKKRIAIERFAVSRYITCFSHIDHELVPFWAYYGGSERSTKILLKFKNFASNLENVLCTDYAWLPNGKKVFFDGPALKTAMQVNALAEKTQDEKDVDFELDNWIKRIEFVNVMYLPAKSEVFTKSYESTVNLDFSKSVITLANSKATENSQVLENATVFKTGSLGKYKSLPWDYEGESRIISCLFSPVFDKWEYIDLRIKEDIFRELEVVLSPWCNKDFEQKINEIIESSPISEEIKASIHISHSDVEGGINII